MKALFLPASVGKFRSGIIGLLASVCIFVWAFAEAVWVVCVRGTKR
jgi:hypothetical protein